MWKGVHILIAGVLLSTGTVALADERAANISIGSIGGALDIAAMRTVRNVVGQAVGNGTVDTFIVYAPQAGGPILIEGGLYACAEAGYGVTKSAFAGFVQQLRSIRPRPGTFFTLKLAASCNRTGVVACTLDVRRCPDGTYVGRLPPSCEFASCPGPAQPAG